MSHMPTDAQRATARAFVEVFAQTRTYGGGREAILKIGPGDYLRALDGWGGRAMALDRLAQQVVERFVAQMPAPEQTRESG